MKAYTDIEQSKKLAEILPLESADMYFNIAPDEGYSIEVIQDSGFIYHQFENTEDFNDCQYLPCWSLAALIGVLPEVNDNKPAIFLNDNSIIYPYVGDLSVKADNLIDACYEMILKLHELKML